MSKRTILPVLTLILLGAVARAESEPCAVVEKFGKATQVIPKAGAVITRFSLQAPVSCGSMIITHGDGFWIRYSNQVTVKLAPNTFFEVGRKAEDTHRVYRGEVLVNGPAGSGAMVFATPNGEVRFEGGVFTVSYQTQSRTTSVASFNRSVEFRNKFNSNASQTVNVGEISRLSIHEARIVPSQPVVMAPSSIKEGVQHFDLPDAERDEMVAIVNRVFESRAKSLVSDLENFREIPEAKEESNRSPASLGRYTPAVDEKEGEYTMKVLRRRLYNDDAELEKKVERKPASVKKAGVKIEDTQKKVIDIKKKKETDRVLKEISTLDTEE